MKLKKDRFTKPFWFITGISVGIMFFVGVFLGMNSYYSKNVWGSYQKSTGILTVYTDSYSGSISIGKSQEVFFHELGHKIWFEIIDDNDREDYRLFYNLTEEDIEEQFADDFSTWTYSRSNDDISLYFDRVISDKWKLPVWWLKKC
jgi:hypothetical protein